MKVLILTGKFGMGHYSASYSIEEQLKSTIENSDVTIVDIFDYTLPHISKLIYRSFSLLINRASICYNIFVTIQPPSKHHPFLGGFVNDM